MYHLQILRRFVSAE